MEQENISIEQIKTILNDYRIGKKPLGKLLGWGEVTIIRYLDGDIPTKEYSDKLKAILHNPFYYYNILEHNKELLTGIAYRKSREAVLSKIFYSKLMVVSYYIIKLYGGQISLSELGAILYYSQGFSLALFDTSFFEEDYILEKQYSMFIKSPEQLYSIEVNMEKKLTLRERELIEGIVGAFSWYGPKMLSALMASERPRLKIARDKENRKFITKDTLKRFFKELLLRYHITKPEEIYRYPDKRIIDIKNIKL